MSQPKSRARIVRGEGRSSAGLIAIAGKSALLPMMMVAALGGSHAWAGSIVDLGSVYMTGKVDATTCFDYLSCTRNTATNSGNLYASSPYSEATTTVHLSTAPTVTAVAKASPISGEGAPSSFLADSKAQVELDYNFAILGPSNISIPVHITSFTTMTITGDDTAGHPGALNNAHIDIEGPGLLIYRLVDTSHGTTGVLDVDQTNLLQTNTLYTVGMVVSADAHTDINSTDTVIATSTMDPSFTFDSTGAYSAYHIAYSSGIGGLTTPLPAGLPLFSSALGGLGFVGWRRKKAAAQVA